MSTPTIGLFGTCGNSRWREPFVAAYRAEGIPFFDPQLPPGTWTPGCVAEENRHLAEDDLVLFPVTHESPGLGSLGEVGFCALQAIRANRFRQMVFLIDPECLDPEATEAIRVESNRARRLVRSKIEAEARHWHNIHLVETLDTMLSLSLRLWRIAVEMGAIGADRRA